jgi:hypothetical protein
MTYRCTRPHRHGAPATRLNGVSPVLIVCAGACPFCPERLDPAVGEGQPAGYRWSRCPCCRSLWGVADDGDWLLVAGEGVVLTKLD